MSKNSKKKLFELAVVKKTSHHTEAFQISPCLTSKRKAMLFF